MSLAQLNDWEVCLIKAFCTFTDLKDQEILAYFTRTGHTVNHRSLAAYTLENIYLMRNLPPKKSPLTSEKIGPGIRLPKGMREDLRN